MRNNGLITIPEAASLAGKTDACLYRHIRKGNIRFQKLSVNGRSVKKVKKADIIDFFSISFQKLSETSQKHTESSETLSETFQKLSETLKEEINQLRKDNITALAPVNQNLSFIVRAIKENQDLKGENQSLLQKLSEQEKNFQKEEEDYKATIEALKTRLEEEENKPWWKKLCS